MMYSILLTVAAVAMAIGLVVFESWALAAIAQSFALRDDDRDDDDEPPGGCAVLTDAALEERAAQMAVAMAAGGRA